MSTSVKRLKIRMPAGSIPFTLRKTPASSISPTGVRKGLCSQGSARYLGKGGTPPKFT